MKEKPVTNNLKLLAPKQRETIDSGEDEIGAGGADIGIPEAVQKMSESMARARRKARSTSREEFLAQLRAHGQRTD